MAVIINGRDLTVEEVIRVCRGYEKVEIAPEAKEAVIKARNYIEKKLEEINPLEITPIEALNILYELKNELKNKK